MSEDKAMSRDEMVVGSYVCSMHMNGMEGEVVAVEIDERGPEYDILRVQMNGWELPQRCQRVVMMLAERPDAEPASEPASDEVADLRLQLDLLKVELKSAVDGRDMATTLLHKRQRDYDNMHAALLRAEKGHADVQEELEKVRDELVTAQAVRAELDALRLDHAALKSTYAEIDAAYNKAHSERYALNEQNIELRAEVAELEAELERRSKVSHEKYAALERDRDLVENAMREASARAQRNEDNLKAVLTREEALRAQLIALEEGAAASRNTARQVAQVAHDRGHEIAHIESREREARAEAAAQRERADMWQAAAQDALGQMAHWRKQAKEGTKLCDTVVGIDFRSTRPIERKLAEVAAEVAAAVASHDDVRRG